MRILLINKIFYMKGGSEAVFFHTADMLEKQGHDVRFFSICNPLNIATGQKAFFAPQQSGIKRITSYFYNVLN